MKTISQRKKPNAPRVKELGVRAEKHEHDLLNFAARLTKQTRNGFILFSSLQAAKVVLAEHNLTEKEIPASAPWK